MTIRIGFSGTGYISQVHARAAQKIAGVELTAVANHRPESMRRFAETFGIPHQADTVQALLEQTAMDCLVVSTPNFLHAPETIAALTAGVHVMVEKPMAMNAVEAEAMLGAGEQHGALLMVAHCWRFDPEARWLRDQVRDGRIGRVIRTKGCGVHANWGPGGWFTRAETAGGGAMADMGIHALDTARFLLGDPWPESVYARIGTHYGDYDVDDTGVVLVNWEGGATSYIESGWWQPHTDGPEAATQLYGQKGFGSLYPTLLELPDRTNARVEEVDPGYLFPRPDHAPQSMYDAQMAHFIDSIRSGATPVPGGEEGLLNMLVVDAAYRSARSGEVARIPPRAEWRAM
jgi:predicted dehydrogenase